MKYTNFENIDDFSEENKDLEEFDGYEDISSSSFSEDEVEIFTKEYVDGLKDKLLCISLGGNGSMYKFNELETLRMIYLLQLLSIIKSTLGILDAEIDKTPSNLTNVKIKLEDYIEWKLTYEYGE